MPDDKGILSVEEREKCDKWFKDHMSGPVECPICKMTDWEIEDYLVKDHILIPGKRNVEGTLVYAFFMLCCKKCRHTMFVNAVDAEDHSEETPVFLVVHGWRLRLNMQPRMANKLCGSIVKS